MDLIVTNGDRVLCRICYEEQFNEQDETTHAYDTTDRGWCYDCGLEPEGV